jgi:hypothetical protein
MRVPAAGSARFRRSVQHLFEIHLDGATGAFESTDPEVPRQRKAFIQAVKNLAQLSSCTTPTTEDGRNRE